MNHEQRVEAIAEEISRYLLGHPGAADSFDGIRHWWLARIRLEEATEHVKQALATLVQRGVVIERALPDGSVLYQSALSLEK